MKNFLTVLLLLTSCEVAVAQKNSVTSFGAGVGINIARVSLKSAFSGVSPNYLTGFRAYIFLDAPVGGHFSLEPELSFDGLGWQFYGDDNYYGGNAATVKTRLNYIFLSILAKYKIQNSGWAFYLGPAYGLLLSAKVTGYKGETHDDKSNYVDGNFAGVLGAEYYFPFGLGLSARYMAGISNLISNSAPGESMHSGSFTITAAYKFHH
jgi:outer membrane immunogenic protein